jgi:hypothetical protein
LTWTFPKKFFVVFLNSPCPCPLLRNAQKRHKKVSQKNWYHSPQCLVSRLVAICQIYAVRRF